jgi:hypothetical protein
MPRCGRETVVNDLQARFTSQICQSCLQAMRIRNVGMLLNASPCQTLTPHDMMI